MESHVNFENSENHRISFENHKKNETPMKNQETHENQRISYENHEKYENLIIPLGNYYK